MPDWLASRIARGVSRALRKAAPDEADLREQALLVDEEQSRRADLEQKKATTAKIVAETKKIEEEARSSRWARVTRLVLTGILAAATIASFAMFVLYGFGIIKMENGREILGGGALISLLATLMSKVLGKD